MSRLKNTGSRSGFTLIEMLIVVAIIGILAGAVLVGLGPVQRQGRDSRRIADLRQVQNALELYYNKCGYYPGTAQAGSPCGAFSQISAWADLSTTITGSTLGVNKVPNDPSAGRNYFYGTNATGSSYTIGATLEDTNNPNLSQDVDGTVNGVDCTDPIYCVEF